MSPAERWLRERFTSAPPRLLEAMLAALPPAATEVDDALASAAMRLYEQVLTGEGGREDALPLLAADALLTHALQARAEREPLEVIKAAERWGGEGLLGTLAGKATP